MRSRERLIEILESVNPRVGDLLWRTCLAAAKCLRSKVPMDSDADYMLTQTLGAGGPRTHVQELLGEALLYMVEDRGENPVTFRYTNWQGETSDRRVIPRKLRFGTSQWHKTPGWLLLAFDFDRMAFREFRMDKMWNWREPEREAVETD
jgi:predicted DNA-binding transcriptional regulator YafY